MAKITVGIVGVTGYAGQELLRILRGHPGVRIGYLASSGKSDPGPVLRHHGRIPVAVEPFDAARCAKACATAFLALPHESSLEAAPAMLHAGLGVLDLSAAFRLRDASLYPGHYGFTHAAEGLLKTAVYGLPELGARLRNARLVAVPGCYPTGPSIALVPLLRKKMVAGPVIIDAKSGVTGAGREAKSHLMFPEVNENISAYGVFNHRHAPEIGQTLSHAAGRTVDLTFTPHLIPMNRGILSTIYVRLAPRATRESVLTAWARAYGRSPFVRILADGLPHTRQVTRTNYCDLGLAVRGRHAIIVTAIDNLVKGAAGQAVQCFNLVHGLPETAGLLDLPGAP